MKLAAFCKKCPDIRKEGAVLYGGDLQQDGRANVNRSIRIWINEDDCETGERDSKFLAQSLREWVTDRRPRESIRLVWEMYSPPWSTVPETRTRGNNSDFKVVYSWNKTSKALKELLHAPTFSAVWRIVVIKLDLDYKGSLSLALVLRSYLACLILSQLFRLVPVVRLRADTLSLDVRGCHTSVFCKFYQSLLAYGGCSSDTIALQ